MAMQSFVLYGAGAHDGPSILTTAGEKVRVRFEEITGNPECRLVIQANGLESSIPIDLTSPYLLATAGIFDNDNVSVRMIGYNDGDSVRGVLESGL